MCSARSRVLSGGRRGVDYGGARAATSTGETLDDYSGPGAAAFRRKVWEYEHVNARGGIGFVTDGNPSSDEW